MTYSARNPHPKHVYFLRRTDGIGPVKIGCSRLPLVRFREFFRWSPEELGLLAFTPGGHDMERKLHHLFGADRLHMEWFAPTDRLMALIACVKAGDDIEAAIERSAIAPMSRAA